MTIRNVFDGTRDAIIRIAAVNALLAAVPGCGNGSGVSVESMMESDGAASDASPKHSSGPDDGSSDSGETSVTGDASAGTEASIEHDASGDAGSTKTSEAADASSDAQSADAGESGEAGTAATRVVGRTAAESTAGSIRFSWPGVSIHARFTGAQVSMNLNDGANQNRFTVVVDNGLPKTVTTTTAASLPLATGLMDGPHDLVVWRNTEAGVGISVFSGLSGFGSGGALLTPSAAPNRRIEVVGDSLSVGAGVEGDAACPNGIDAYTNNYLAYGTVAARTVGADVVTVAWSGIGVYRNYDGSTTNTMPARYPYSIPNDDTPWDFSLYQPAVEVINLGTNDFGQGDPGTAYEGAYVAFVRSIRAKYPSTYFILIDMYGGIRLTRINDVVAALKSGGETNVETLSVSSAQNSLGCNQHPNVAGQAAMGAVLAVRLRSLMGW